MLFRSSFETQDEVHVVMELAMGGELFDRIVECGSFDEPQAKHVTRQLLSVLEFMHARGVLHRDIKPENVLCTDREPHLRGHIKLCDFGFAAEFKQDEAAELPAHASSDAQRQTLTLATSPSASAR